MSFNETMFLKRSIAEKIYEDEEVLRIYYNHLMQIVEERDHYGVFARFYVKKLRDMLNVIGEALENLKNIDYFAGHYTTFRLKWIHDTIYLLTVFCMHLDRALRHRSSLFDSKIKIYAPHYAFEPLYKTLISCDAILYESIDRSEAFRENLFLLSYFGEKGPATPPDPIRIPEHLSQTGLIKNISISTITRIGFVTVPRHMHLHSRCTIDNIHEAMHNLIELYLNLKVVPERLKKAFIDLAEIYARYVHERADHYIELFCDILSTAVSFFAYPIASVASDLYYLEKQPILPYHPPDAVRNYACFLFTYEYMSHLVDELEKRKGELAERIEKIFCYVKFHAKQYPKHLHFIHEFIEDLEGLTILIIPLSQFF